MSLLIQQLEKIRGKDSSKRGQRLAPPALSERLRGWIDNCLVPALVREYLAEQRPENGACSGGEPVAEFAATNATSADLEEGR